MKYFLYSIVFFVILTDARPQVSSNSNLNQLFEFEKILCIGRNDGYHGKFLVYYDGNTLGYYLNDIYRRDDSTFFNIQFYNDSNISKSYHLPDSIRTDNGAISDFVFNDSLVICLKSRYLLIYQRNLCKIKKIINLPNSFRYLELQKEAIYCYLEIGENINNELTTLCSSVQFSIDGEFLKYNLFKDYQSYDTLEINERKIMDISENSILIADLANYKIHLYNNNGGLVDSIEVFPDNWCKYGSSLDYKKLYEKYKNTKTYIRHFGMVNFLSIIENVYFVNSNKIYVHWSSPVKLKDYRNNYLDIFIKSNGKWIQQSSFILDTIYNHKDNDFLINLPDGFSWKYTINDSYLITTELIPFEINGDEIKMNYQQYEAKWEYYLTDSHLSYSFFIRKIK